MGEGLHEVTGASESHCGATFSLSCVNTITSAASYSASVHQLYTPPQRSKHHPKDQSTASKDQSPTRFAPFSLQKLWFKCLLDVGSINHASVEFRKPQITPDWTPPPPTTTTGVNVPLLNTLSAWPPRLFVAVVFWPLCVVDSH